ncbi:hypothetical protein P4H61_11405 [Paenibacillus peoriae]|nr:hypothetical protein [Paenibacillus peoriae]MEC0182099.1 hypothetical protein [Paenibacillus peoriae]
MVEYKNIVDLTRRVSKYVKDKGLTGKPVWVITDEDMESAVSE